MKNLRICIAMAVCMLAFTACTPLSDRAGAQASAPQATPTARQTPPATPAAAPASAQASAPIAGTAVSDALETPAATNAAQALEDMDQSIQNILDKLGDEELPELAD